MKSKEGKVGQLTYESVLQGGAWFRIMLSFFFFFFFLLFAYVPIGIFYLLVKSEEQQEDILQVSATSFHALLCFLNFFD